MQHEQSSSILSEEELSLLAYEEAPIHANISPLYSLAAHFFFEDIECQTVNDINVLILLISSGQSGSGLILTPDVEQSKHYPSLIKLLNTRSDITIFWYKQLPRETSLLEHHRLCESNIKLEQAITQWCHETLSLFNDWVRHYRVGFITNVAFTASPKQLQGLQSVSYYNVQQALSIERQQLLILDLNTSLLPIPAILSNLTQAGESPFIVLFGDIHANLANAVLHLVTQSGFSVLACLNYTPTIAQTRQLLTTLFTKVYLKHSFSHTLSNLHTQGVYSLSEQKMSALYYPYGMSKKQISTYSHSPTTRKIIHVDNILDWYPEGINREQANKLSTELDCTHSFVDFHLKYPKLLSIEGPLFMFIVMARLRKSHIYWLIEEEADLSLDALVYLPISHLVLSTKLIHQLIASPSSTLISFIEEAKVQEIKLGAIIERHLSQSDLLSLYGIEFILDQEESLE